MQGTRLPAKPLEYDFNSELLLPDPIRSNYKLLVYNLKKMLVCRAAEDFFHIFLILYIHFSFLTWVGGIDML